MGFDPGALAALVAAHGPVIRVVVADCAGSTPREVGAAMCVWADGAEGTIGGGALEHEATLAARAMLAVGEGDRIDRLALGPARGQCCGGAVTILSERWTAGRVTDIAGPVVARPLPGKGQDMPMAVRRLLGRARQGDPVPSARIVQGWFIEPLSRPRRDLWVWGAGHVGRAIVATLHPLPDLRLTWIDTGAERFPELPAGVVRRIASNPAELVREAPEGAEHLILTFSHALDLEICHQLLRHRFAWAGLIGSATKWARFRSRLAQLGHAPDEIARITCPIGRPALGKHPQAIAIGVALDFLERPGTESAHHAGGPTTAARGGRAG